MKVAIVYNRVSQKVINLFGLPNREKYGRKNIGRIRDALRKGGHQVAAFEGDKELINHLEEFMPRVMKHERPGMVFNVSYGIQGQARYTHVPGMLEMIGLPYVGSGPLAHSLALDKVVSKMLFIQHGLPTPDFAVLDAPGFQLPPLDFPLIVKPKNEAVSFGIRIVHNEEELREAASTIFKEFRQAALVEQFIAGREINVGLLGNHPTEPLPPAELIFGASGPPIYTWEDKTRKSGREVGIVCPAQLDEPTTRQAQQLARRAFEVLGCFDCARVDMRLDANGKLYILEVNSLPSLGEHGSYVFGAAAAGLDFPALVNRLVDVAAARYFGTPKPPELAPMSEQPADRIASYLSSQRDAMERQIREWSLLKSRTFDPVGTTQAVRKLEEELLSLKLEPVKDLTDPRVAWTWQTRAGMDQGTLLIGHVDVPLEPDLEAQEYRIEPEWLYGEGVGSSRGGIVTMLFALRALRHARSLRHLPIGVLFYADEGRDCRYSADVIREAMSRVRRVLVLRPGHGASIVTSRLGQRRYQLAFSGPPLQLGKKHAKPEVLAFVFDRLQQCAHLTSLENRVAVSTIDLKTEHLPLLLPHKVTASLLASYADAKDAPILDQQIRTIFNGSEVTSKLELVSDRPPMKERRATALLARALEHVAADWEIPLKRESSVWPSVAGLAPAKTAVVCGMGPVARGVYTPEECVDRISLRQRTLLLAAFLSRHGAPAS
jgi:D-alanine-D-alanine ligase